MKSKVLTIISLVVLACLALANPPVGQRFARKGTFKGDPAQLLAIGNSKPIIAADYDQVFGPGWNKPGALVVVGGPTKIPDRAYVPHNALIYKGKVVHWDTCQRGDDQAWYVKNTKTGKGSMIKSCGQDFSSTPPPKTVPPAYESDSDVDVSANAEADAEATADATATATGGNATAMVVYPQPLWIPVARPLGEQQGERYSIGGISWVPQTKIDIKNINKNVNTNTLTQTQSQAQAQDLAVAIGA